MKKIAGQKNYYKVLEIDRNASKREIKKAYRKLAKQWHPDKYDGNDKEGALKKMNEINEAYEILKNDELRGRFDNGDDPNVFYINFRINPKITDSILTNFFNRDIIINNSTVTKDFILTFK